MHWLNCMLCRNESCLRCFDAIRIECYKQNAWKECEKSRHPHICLHSLVRCAWFLRLVILADADHCTNQTVDHFTYTIHALHCKCICSSLDCDGIGRIMSMRRHCDGVRRARERVSFTLSLCRDTLFLLPSSQLALVLCCVYFVPCATHDELPWLPEGNFQSIPAWHTNNGINLSSLWR